ncbi:hypothetical protein PCAR4_290137 [Paraburkholderia caribensis]|nr:hypothetical protein PCAR4_290137 [Paraburkholderia caribensis]
MRFLSLLRANGYARQTAIGRIEKPNWERITELLDLMHGSGARVWPVVAIRNARSHIQALDGGSDGATQGFEDGGESEGRICG